METMQPVVDRMVPNVIQSDTGYLVDGNYGGNAVDVAVTDTGLECQCFIAQVSDGQCEHVRIVRDYLANNPVPDDEPVISQADADHYLSRVSELDATLDANAESANKQIDRIKLWLESETTKIEHRRDHYLLVLDNYMHLNGLSTKCLVNGTIKVRSQQPEIQITDEEQVLANERFIRVIPEKRAIDKAALRKYCTQTGEEVPGTKIILKPHKFSYKLIGGI
jgi:phage host-nuclease inhibitor protein Gam